MSEMDLEQIRQRKIQAMLDQAVKNKRVNTQPITIDDASFQGIVQSHELLVVDFWAPWCSPCRAVSPLIEQLAAEYAGQVTFGKMNVDENQMVPSSFGIMSIPTIVVFYRGQAVERIIGAYPKTHIEEILKRHLNK